MIIAIGVVSCIAVLLGIIILEIAVDKKKKKASTDAKKNEQSVSENVEINVVPETTVNAEKPAKETVVIEESVKAEESVSVEEVKEEQTAEEYISPLPDTEVATQSFEIVPDNNESNKQVAELTPETDGIEETVLIEEPAPEKEPILVEEPTIFGEVVEETEQSLPEPADSNEETEVAEEATVRNESNGAETESVTESAESVNDSNESDEEEEDSSDSDEGDNEEVSSELKVVVKNGETRYIVIKYSKSFQAKLIQGSDDTKRYYTELKNCLLSYGVKSRMSWKWESFRYGRKTLAKLRLRGKTLSIVLALNPDDYADTKYHVESVADILCYADTPCLYRIKNERRLKYTKDLIAKLMQDNGLVANPLAENVDYSLQYPYETTEALIERKLIKVLTDEDAQSGEVFMPSDIRKSVKAQDVDNILQDEVAAELIEKLDGVSDKTKTGIINIDTLSQNFEDGETVTLDEIKKRINGYGKTTYIKVLARGTLDKKLTVEADDFSLQAVKMIVLIGGKAVKK